MKQERVARARTKTDDRQAVEEILVEEPEADLLTDVDELLDEIDKVLEDQAVLVSYRQRSGE